MPLDRKEFIGRIGMTGIFIACARCLTACTYDVLNEERALDFTIDLSDALYQSLSTAGGSAYRNGILIVYTINGQYIAVDQQCTHEESLLAYYPTGIIFCGKHGSAFNTDGSVIQGPAVKALKTYKTQLTGKMLRIYN